MQRIASITPPVNPDPDFNELEYTKKLLSGHDPDCQCCQRCGKKLWNSGKTATYTRALIWPKDNKPVYDRITISVHLCEKCGRDGLGTGTASGDYHHALLGMNMIPFSSYTLSFVLAVLRSYSERTGTVQSVCEQWEISMNTLYAWIKRYKDQYNAWADSARRLSGGSGAGPQDPAPPRRAWRAALAASLAFLISALEGMAWGFFRRFAFSFLQGSRKTHFRELPINRRPRL